MSELALFGLGVAADSPGFSLRFLFTDRNCTYLNCWDMCVKGQMAHWHDIITIKSWLLYFGGQIFKTVVQGVNRTNSIIWKQKAYVWFWHETYNILILNAYKFVSELEWTGIFLGSGWHAADSLGRFYQLLRICLKRIKFYKLIFSSLGTEVVRFSKVPHKLCFGKPTMRDWYSSYHDYSAFHTVSRIPGE